MCGRHEWRYNSAHGLAGLANRAWWANKWVLPAFSAALGLGLWAASWAGGNHGQGAISFGIMTAFGAVFVVGFSDRVACQRG